MNFRFPLKDVTVRISEKVRKVQDPLFSGAYWQMNQDEFAMQVEGVCSLYACHGNEVEVYPEIGVDPQSVELYLHGSVYGAILHQRKILPLHGSSFVLGGRGVLICGESGSGKSSLTAAFVIDGAGFLTDDITPLIERDGKILIWAVSDRIKLWNDALRQLDRDAEVLSRIYPGMEKFYYPVTSSGKEVFNLDEVYIIEPGGSDETVIRELEGPERFEELRNQIYRYEYLSGMPENEPVYFRYLVDICNSAPVMKIKRPERTDVRELVKTLMEYRQRWQDG